MGNFSANISSSSSLDVGANNVKMDKFSLGVPFFPPFIWISNPLNM